MQVSTLRPGLLVGLKTSVKGNVSYTKTDIEPENIREDGSLHALWETTKTVEDAAEHDEAIKVRSKCRSLIIGVCSRSAFGLLCPESRAEMLAARFAEAKALAEAFNLTARLSRIEVNIITGRVAQDDVQAMMAINSEVRELLDTMEQGMQRLDVATVREAANKAKELGQMLSPQAAERIEEAISAVRSAARKIVKAGEAGAVAVDEAVLAQIRQSRAGFLDLGDEVEIAAPVHVGRGVELDPEAEAGVGEDISEEERDAPLADDEVRPTVEVGSQGDDVKAALAAVFGSELVESLAAEVEGSEERIAEAILASVEGASITDSAYDPGNPATHSTLCECPLCEAEYGETAVTISQPVHKPVAIEIE